MKSRSREGGLSEAVGFLLILAAVIVTFSIYLLYIIPAMGREGEVATMTEVKERLAEYKLDIDTLWTSHQCSTAYGPALSIGAGKSGGFLSFIPFFNPPKEYPVLALNRRDEYITISSDSYLAVTSAGYNETAPLGPSVTNFNVNNPPQHLFITLVPSDLTVQRGVLVQGPTWSAWVNITPRANFVNRFNMTVDQYGNVTNFWSWNESLVYSTDITVNTFRGQSPLVADLAVYRGIQGSTVYPVDLMNPAYGISPEFQNPQALSARTSDAALTASYWVSYGYAPQVSTTTSAMGSLEFISNNYYYVPQTYYYQLGGVFLEQQDGATAEVPPSISISYVNGSPVVKVGKILLWGSIEATSMVGSGPITMATAVTDIQDAPLAPGKNTRWVNLSVQAANTNTAQMWLRTLRGIADQGGLPATAYTNGTAGTVSFLNITGNPQLYDVQLSLTQVNVSGDYLEETLPGGITRGWRSLQSYRGPPLPITWTVPPTTVIPTPTPPPAPSYGANPPWSCGWGYRRNITINASAVNGTLSSFPVLVNITSDTGLRDHVRSSSGYDIFFTSDDGQTRIPYEREYYNPGDGGLIAWVKVPSVTNTTNTTIYMYYGNQTATDQQDKNGVWDSNNYKGVWHLNETSGNFADSTLYGNTATDYVSATGKTGKIGFGQQFDGDDYGQVANADPLNPTSKVTFGAWIYPTAGATQYYSVLMKPFVGAVGGNEQYFIQKNGAADYPIIGVKAGGSMAYAQATTTWSSIMNKWTYVVGTYDGSNLIIYINAVPETTTPKTGDLNTDTNTLGIGGHSSTYTEFIGNLDEVRISSTNRSADWIKTEYSNQNRPDLFAYVLPEDPSPACPILVQSKAAGPGTGSTASVTLDQAGTNGNLMILSFVVEPQSLSVSSVTDGKGNTYNLARGPDPLSNWGNLYTYYAANIQGTPTTLTVQFSGSSTFYDIYASEFSGIATTNPLDQTSAGTGSTAVIDSGAKNTTQARELIYGFAATDTTATPNAPFSLISGYDGNFVAYNDVYAIYFYNVTGTNSGGNWACQMATFKAG